MQLQRSALLTAWLALAGSAGVAHADLISYYNFNNNLPSGTVATFPRTPAQGNGSLTFVGGAPANAVFFGGTTVNAVGTDPAGNSLAIQNGTAGANNGSFQQYQLSTLGFRNLVLSYATQGTSTGFNNQSVSYSTNGTTFINVASPFAIPTSFATRTVDLSSITALNDQASVFIRITNSGGSNTSAAGNNRFDNVQFNAAASVTGNNTTLTATPLNVDFGRVIMGATPTRSITLNKTGSDTTGFSITSSGGVTSDSLGGAFLAGPQSTTFNVGVTTTTAGAQSGAVVVDNLAVSSAAAGQGSADANEVIGVAATVLSPANASFDAIADQDADAINLGTLTQGDAAGSQSFSIFNLIDALGSTSALDLDSIQFIGADSAGISTDLATFSGLAAGGSMLFNASLDTAQVGAFSETLLLSFSDEDVLGETVNTLTLTLTGEVVAAPIPEPATLSLLAMGALGLLRRPRRRRA